MTRWKLPRTALALVLTASFVVLLVLYLTAGHATLLLSTVEAREGDFWSLWRTTKRFLITAVLMAGLLYAVGLVEQRKIVALYLRRFRMNTEVLNPQHTGGLGRSIRLVTLQDRTFPPYAVSAKETALSLLVPLALITLVFVTTNAMNTIALPIVSDDNEPFWRSHILYSHYVAWLAIAAMLLALLHRLSLHLRQVTVVRRPEDVARVIAMAYSLSSPWKRPSLLGMRSTVVGTAHTLWKDTVSQLLDAAQVVVIDVSELSENVLWELEQLSELRLPTVLIGTAAGLTATAGAAGSGHFPNPLADFLKNCDQLAFDQADAQSVSKFRSRLTQALRLAARPRSVLRAPTGRARVRIAAVALNIAVSIAVLGLSGLIVFWQSDTLLEVLRLWMP